jgi:serine/threonine-protein kinase
MAAHIRESVHREGQSRGVKFAKPVRKKAAVTQNVRDRRPGRDGAKARDVNLQQGMSLARGTMPITLGMLVGPYEIREVIGAGGMGVVFEAQLPVGKRVALKLLHPQRVDDERAIRRFHDEAMAGLIVQHENLVSTLDHGETADGLPFLVMERLCGEPLGRRIQRDAVPSPKRAVDIVRQILAGLGALHAAGIVHGDIKSDNVMVETASDGNLVVRLIDLGLAHVQFGARDEVRRPAKDEELVSGTPEYMAPEVIRGEGSSTASDLYATGVILYELLTGATPFAGGSPQEIVRRHLEDEVVPPSLRCDEVPPILERIVMRALEKDPAKRFPSADAFASALAVTLPLLSDALGQRITMEFSAERPTMDWSADVRKRIARGTPRYAKPKPKKAAR